MCDYRIILMISSGEHNNLTIGSFGWVFYVLAFVLYTLQKYANLMHPYILMTFDVSFIIYIGTYMSMRFFSVAGYVRPLTIRNKWWKYPLYSFAGFMGAYVSLHNFGQDFVNSFLLLAFCCLGTLAIKNWIEGILSQNIYMNAYKSMYFPLLTKFGIKLSRFDLICFCPSVTIVILYTFNKDLILNNICAISFCLYVLKTIYIGKMSVGFIMLALFLMCDIYFIMVSNIMQTLAVNLYGPIKLLYPVKDNKFALLVLEDVLVPGLLIALCLRIDLLFHLKRKLSSKSSIKNIFPESSKEFAKPYFIGSFIGYLLGFLLALIVSNIINVPQTALLYLTPCTILGIVVVALSRGEIRELMSIDEENVIKKLMEENNVEVSK